MSVVLLAILLAVSIGLNAICVRLANRYSIGIKLTYKRSLVIVGIRSLVALGAGLAVGIVMSELVKSDAVQLGAVELSVLCFAGILSFWVYQKLLAYFTGETVRSLDVVKSVLTETLIFIGLALLLGATLGFVFWLFEDLIGDPV